MEFYLPKPVPRFLPSLSSVCGLVVCCLALGACGQKGPLYLPEGASTALPAKSAAVAPEKTPEKK